MVWEKEGVTEVWAQQEKDLFMMVAGSGGNQRNAQITTLKNFQNTFSALLGLVSQELGGEPVDPIQTLFKFAGLGQRDEKGQNPLQNEISNMLTNADPAKLSAMVSNYLAYHPEGKVLDLFSQLAEDSLQLKDEGAVNYKDLRSYLDAAVNRQSVTQVLRDQASNFKLASFGQGEDTAGYDATANNLYDLANQY